jgi:hypothetical protein
MSKQAALSVLIAVESVIEANRDSANRRGVSDGWQRDRDFLSSARLCIESGDPECLRQLLDEMRSLSQGFGSYCDEVSALDSLDDALFHEIQLLVLTR